MPEQPLKTIQAALFDLVGVLNSPQPDAVLLAEAGVSLDRALFPLLVRIERKGPLGIVELADHAGRDHTTVSRQVTKLEQLGLVVRRPGKTDRRVREVAITKAGLKITNALDQARARLSAPLLADWSEKEQRELARLLRKLADAALDWSRRET